MKLKVKPMCYEPWRLDKSRLGQKAINIAEIECTEVQNGILTYKCVYENPWKNPITGKRVRSSWVPHRNFPTESWALLALMAPPVSNCVYFNETSFNKRKKKHKKKKKKSKRRRYEH